MIRWGGVEGYRAGRFRSRTTIVGSEHPGALWPAPPSAPAPLVRGPSEENPRRLALEA